MRQELEFADDGGPLSPPLPSGKLSFLFRVTDFLELHSPQRARREGWQMNPREQTPS